jgi:hypothetical protein
VAVAVFAAVLVEVEGMEVAAFEEVAAEVAVVVLLFDVHPIIMNVQMSITTRVNVILRIFSFLNCHHLCVYSTAL